MGSIVPTTWLTFCLHPYLPSLAESLASILAPRGFRNAAKGTCSADVYAAATVVFRRSCILFHALRAYYSRPSSSDSDPDYVLLS